MSWYRLELREEFLPENHLAWRAAWTVAHEGATPHPGHALFRASGPGKGVTLYFPPMERTLAETFGATPCDKPSYTSLRLVSGDGGAWETYFPQMVQQLAKRRTEIRHDGHFLPTQPLGPVPSTHTHGFEPTYPLPRSTEPGQLARA
jgi:hypothetical protein